MHVKPDKPILLFDGVCNLCNGLVKFIIKRDRKAKIRFSPLQSSAGKEILARHGVSGEPAKSVVFSEGERYYLRSSAVLHLLKALGGGWKLFYAFIIIPPFIRDFMYDVIARNRYRIFGHTLSCMVPGENIKDRFLV